MVPADALQKYDLVKARTLFEKALQASKVLKLTKLGHIKRRLPFTTSASLSTQTTSRTVYLDSITSLTALQSILSGIPTLKMKVRKDFSEAILESESLIEAIRSKGVKAYTHSEWNQAKDQREQARRENRQNQIQSEVGQAEVRLVRVQLLAG